MDVLLTFSTILSRLAQAAQAELETSGSRLRYYPETGRGLLLHVSLLCWLLS